MERGFEEKVKKMKTEELLRFLERGGVYALLAASEGLERFEKGDPEIEKNFLLSVLKAKIEGKMKEGGKEIKRITAEILKERFFDKETVETIIKCGDLEKEERERVMKKYLQLNEKDRDLLKTIAQLDVSEEIENLVVEKLLQLEPTNDELILILPLNSKSAEKKIFELLLQRELQLEEYCDLIMICKQSDIAEKFFEKMKKAKKIENLGEEDLEDLRLSENQKISSWATKKLIKKLKGEEKKLNEKMKSVKDPFEKQRIWGKIVKTEEKIEALKKELKGEKKIKTEISSLALASNFFYFYNEVIYEIYPAPLLGRKIQSNKGHKKW